MTKTAQTSLRRGRDTAVTTCRTIASVHCPASQGHCLLGSEKAVFISAHPFHYLRTLSYSFSIPRRNSDTGSLCRLFFPLPTTVRAFMLSRNDSGYFFHRRLAPICRPAHAARRSLRCQFLVLSLFLQTYWKKVRPTWDSNPRINSAINSINSINSNSRHSRVTPIHYW